jgi:hypothetical protein
MAMVFNLVLIGPAITLDPLSLTAFIIVLPGVACGKARRLYLILTRDCLRSSCRSTEPREAR